MDLPPHRSAAQSGRRRGPGARPAAKRFINAALVTGDTVYFGDIGGTIYALDRPTGRERWKIDTRARPFPGAHSSNCIFSSPDPGRRQGRGRRRRLRARRRRRPEEPRLHRPRLRRRPGAGHRQGGLEIRRRPRAEGARPAGHDQVRIGASARSIAAHRPARSGVRRRSTPRARPSSSAPIATMPRASRRRTTRGYPPKHSCAVIALDARTGAEKWVTQITPDDVWNYALPAYDPKTGYKDQSIGDTPKIYTIDVDGRPTQGRRLRHEERRLLRPRRRHGRDPAPHAHLHGSAARSASRTWTRARWPCPAPSAACRPAAPPTARPSTPTASTGWRGVPTGGRVVSISLDTTEENWRHERPKVKAVGGTTEKPAFRNVGDPVASGIALANGVAYFTTTVSNKLVALDTATGQVLKEIELAPSGAGRPSRAAGSMSAPATCCSPGNPHEAYFPKSAGRHGPFLRPAGRR